MAAPATLTSCDITGKYIMNEKLSDPNVIEDILRVQGVSWALRKAITLATVTLSIKHHTDDLGVEHIEVVNTLTGGIPGNTELSVMDWTDRAHEDYVFGKVLGRSKRVDSLETIEDSFLKESWDVSRGGKEDGVFLLYDESAEEGRPWNAEQVWGFTVVNGERRHARRIRITGKDGKTHYFRLIYNYLGPL
ncbi:hypothetical protein BDM02DRAFT_3144633, partial [Thelephora ganbajun]